MREIILGYIEKQLLNNQATITSQDDLLGSGLIDSMGVMRLIAFIEQEFDHTVAAQDMTIENFISVEAIEDYLKSAKTV